MSRKPNAEALVKQKEAAQVSLREGEEAILEEVKLK
jgi:hypothetical protein